MLCSPNTQVMSRGAVHSGAYNGIYKVCELRDDDQNRNFGKDIGKALYSINTEIAPLVFNAITSLGICLCGAT